MKQTHLIVEYPATLQQQAQKSLILAADWAARNQIRDAWPAWDANKGRFPYHILIDPAKRAKQPQVWSTCWKTARAAQGLYSAYMVTGKPAHLAAANLAMEYVATLQVFDPAYDLFRGTFLEDSPQGPHVAVRDGIEAMQGFAAGYAATKNKRYLIRACAGADFLLRMVDRGWFPFGTSLLTKRPDGIVRHFCFYTGALVMAQLYRFTGKREYLTRAVIPWADTILEEYIRSDGAIGWSRCTEKSHHVISQGPLTGVAINDDGVGVALLGAYAVTGKKKYLDAAVGAADFWTRVETDLPALAPYPAVALFLADVYRMTRDRKYLPKIDEYIRKTLALQCRSRDPMLHGCFIGEDMAKHYDKRSKPTDYVDLRITAYALIALAKIAAKKPRQWGCSYSCFGC